MADDAAVTPSRRPSRTAVVMIVGVVAVLAFGGLTGWLGYRSYQTRQVEQRRAMFLRAATQLGVDLTTIDAEHVEADVQRVLDSATGTFYDDYETQAPAFIDAVKKAKSTSVGKVGAAAVESMSDHSAQVLVAVTMQTSTGGAPATRPVRMRMVVQDVGGQPRVSNVDYPQ
jgi:Mce-associated membrane protein